MSWKSEYGKSAVAGAVLAIGMISGAAQAIAEPPGEVPVTRVEASAAFPCIWPVCVLSSGRLGAPGGLSE
ncbi:hypothetical protein [Nocardia anaemiae]|uniref:hypothetical protein n=1 Tax=Nocardia anaemiae TaxID=263910 RepID=UPI0007A53BE7|nr:hypothetical protein [Nocardia anaemiae]